MAFEAECFFGTLEQAQARANVIGADVIDGPFNTLASCEAKCDTVGTTTDPPPGCGDCGEGEMQAAYFTQFAGLTDGTCGKCTQIAGAIVHLGLHEAVGNCYYLTLFPVLSCGGSGWAHIAMEFDDGDGKWYLQLVYPSGTVERIYECAAAAFFCGGQSTFTRIGASPSDACANWPATVPVWS